MTEQASMGPRRRVAGAVARDAVSAVAPDELVFFDAACAEFFRDPERALAGRRPRDEILGYGPGEVVELVTPAALAVAAAMLGAVAERAGSTLADQLVRAGRRALERLLVRGGRRAGTAASELADAVSAARAFPAVPDAGAQAAWASGVGHAEEALDCYQAFLQDPSGGFVDPIAHVTAALSITELVEANGRIEAVTR